MKKSCLSFFGFTLIELLVVITVMGILFTLGIAGYNEFNRQQILDQATKQVKSDLRLAQQKALSGEKPAGCTTNLSGHRVRFTNSSYSLVAFCPGSNPEEISIKTVTLPQNVTFPNPSPSPILFKVLAQGTDITTPRIITLSAFSKTKTITVTTGGEIN